MEDAKRPNKRLQHERELRGWSQAYVAEKIGSVEKTVSRWECGEQTPGPNYRRRLCKLFGKNALELGFMSQEVDNEPPLPQESSDQQDSAKTLYSDGEVVLEAKEDTLSTIIRLTPEQAASLLRLLALGDITMANFDPKRRAAMLHLLSAVSMLTVVPQSLTDPELWDRLNALGDKPSNIDTATLEHFETLTSTCWELSNAGQLQIAEQVLPSFLPNLLQIAPYDPGAASLAAQSLKL